MNPSWVKWCIFKTSQRSHSLERAQEVKFFPQWSGEGQKSVMSMSSDIVTSAHSRPDVRNFLTSGNGCFQSPSFPHHVTKTRRALGTRMDNWPICIGCARYASFTITVSIQVPCDGVFVFIFSKTMYNKTIIRFGFCCPRRDFAKKAKSRRGTLVTRAYIKERRNPDEAL